MDIEQLFNINYLNFDNSVLIFIFMIFYSNLHDK